MEYNRNRRLSRRDYNDRERYHRRYERSRSRSIERTYRRHERSRSKERKYSYERRTNYKVRRNYVRPTSSINRELTLTETTNHNKVLSSEEHKVRTEERTYRDRSVNLQRKTNGTERQYREMAINEEHIKARYVYSQDEGRYEINYEEYRRKSNIDRNAKDDSTGGINMYYSHYRDRHQMQVVERQNIAKINNEERRFYGEFVENSRPDREYVLQNMRIKLINSMEENRKWNNRHWSEKEFFEMNERDWSMFREDYDITVTGDNIPPPVISWNECKMHRKILQAIQNAGYKTPTAIQMQAIPIGLENRDIVGVAETGSGKTLAYLIPLLNWIIELPIAQRIADTKKGPNALILAPTRELARQITHEIHKFGLYLGIRTVLKIEGVSHDPHYLHEYLTICDILVATPGILANMLRSQCVDLTYCTYVVVAEADQMISLGLESAMVSIFDYFPVLNMQTNSESDSMRYRNNNHNNMYRRTVMFTANMSHKVKNIAKEYLRNPVVVRAGTSGPLIKRIEQIVIIIKDSDKFTKLGQYLSEFKPPIIIFVNEKMNADQLVTDLHRFKYNASLIHGDTRLSDIKNILANFRAGYTDILVTTDIIGRGIDIANVSLVVNYDMAYSVEDYMHRIGRTGRAGKNGVAVTFCTNNDSHLFNNLRAVVMSSPKHRWIQEIST